MNKETYVNLQLANIENAVNLGENVIKTARTINNLKDKKKEPDDVNAFYQDSMKYFSFNDAIASIEFLPLQVKDFKNQLIEIKIANDKMLLEGGFVPDIDREIAAMFVDSSLGHAQLSISNITADTEAAIAILNQMKEDFKKM